jgi:MFS family permease
VSTVLGYAGRQNGLSVGQVGSLVAFSLLPQTWKFLWAPASDALWTRKGWYLASVAICAATIAIMGFPRLGPATLPLFEAMAFANSLASTFLAMSTEAMMVHGTPPEGRGRAGGWSQAGNLAGGGLGGGLGLFLWMRLPAPWMASTFSGLAMLLPALALLGLPEPPRDHDGGVPIRARLAAIARDLAGVLRTRAGFLAAFLCLLPAGACAASNLFAAIAPDWGASSSLVEWTNGSLAGVVMAVGSLAGGRISDVMDRKRAYVVCALAVAAVGVGMWLSPRAPWSYALYTLLYAFASGLCYGTYAAFVLEAVGGSAAATKYNAFASVANIPIAYMTKINGWAADRFGSARMMLVDAVAGVAGVMLFMAMAAAVGAWARRAAVARDVGCGAAPSGVAPPS